MIAIPIGICVAECAEFPIFRSLHFMVHTTYHLDFGLHLDLCVTSTPGPLL